MIRWLAFLAALALAACGASDDLARLDSDRALPKMRQFSAPSPLPPRQSNARIARDFLDLAFRLENGVRLTTFTRFAEPIDVAVRGAAPATLSRDLDRLLTRLRREAGIDISRSRDPETANIVIEAVSPDQMRRASTTASCIARPNVRNWNDFISQKSAPDTSWPALKSRQTVAVFLRTGTAPQEVRDCLHEEIAQSLGPVNDLYRLTDSIFNDDNFHTVLTGYDMLILRAYYDPALQNGMSEADVARRLPAILARLNPAGGARGIAARQVQRADWTDMMIRVTTTSAGKQSRRALAQRAVNLAITRNDPPSHQALAYFWLGRLYLATDAARAQTAFLAAERLYARTPGAAIQRANVAMHLAVLNLSAGRSDQVLDLVARHLPTARASEDAILLSRLLFLRAEAYDINGETRAATQARREALAWARYGFGSDAEVRARAAEFRSISPISRPARGPA